MRYYQPQTKLSKQITKQGYKIDNKRQVEISYLGGDEAKAAKI